MNKVNIVFIMFVLLIMLYLLYGTQRNKEDSFIINTLVRGCARWAIASKQDASPLIALLHANYAAGYLWAIKDVYSGDRIQRLTGVDIVTFQNKITTIQDNATKRVSQICPTFAKEIASDRYLATLAGDV